VKAAAGGGWLECHADGCRMASRKNLYWLLRISVPKQSSKQQREQQYRLLLDVEMERKRI
jgi:hypothetical protein